MELNAEDNPDLMALQRLVEEERQQLDEMNQVKKQRRKERWQRKRRLEEEISRLKHERAAQEQEAADALRDADHASDELARFAGCLEEREAACAAAFQEASVLRQKLSEQALQHAREELEELQRELAAEREAAAKAAGSEPVDAEASALQAEELEAELQKAHAEAAALRGKLAPAAGAAAKGTGKGKGKGKGKGGALPPPPPSKAPSKAAGASPASAADRSGSVSRKKSNLISLHWKVLQESQSIGSSASNPFLAKTSELAASFGAALGAAVQQTTEHEAAARCRRREQLRLSSQRPSLGAGASPSGTSDPADDAFASAGGDTPAGDETALQLDTVFASGAEVRDFPAPLLETYFKIKETGRKMPQLDGAVSEQPGLALLDAKRLQMLGIVVRKYMMAHKGESERQAVLALKLGVLRCDYDVVKQEALALIRTVLRHHAEGGSKVSEYVRECGEEALQHTQHPETHRLIHELLKVPQIDERLECMLFETDFERGLAKCQEQLATLRQALDVLHSKRNLLRTFFCTAHRLGQALNRDSRRATQAPRGFQLQSLEKLVQTRSTKTPKYNVLHFVLALMPPQQLRELFTASDVKLLGRAKAVRSFIVYQECVELVQGFYGVREICETGNYTRGRRGAPVRMERRRKTMAPGQRPSSGGGGSSGAAPGAGGTGDAEGEGCDGDSVIDDDDRFHDAMQRFVDAFVDDAQAIARGCFEAFRLYKDLAAFFEDVGSVYPPPRNDDDPKADLVAVFHRFAHEVVRHGEEVEQDSLHLQIRPQEPPSNCTPMGVAAADGASCGSSAVSEDMLHAGAQAWGGAQVAAA